MNSCFFQISIVAFISALECDCTKLSILENLGTTLVKYFFTICWRFHYEIKIFCKFQIICKNISISQLLKHVLLRGLRDMNTAHLWTFYRMPTTMQIRFVLCVLQTVFKIVLRRLNSGGNSGKLFCCWNANGSCLDFHHCALYPHGWIVRTRIILDNMSDACFRFHLFYTLSLSHGIT